MSHLDEGTLHALLDGELELAEVKEIQLHLGSCAACGSRLQDVKEFLAEADRLVGTLGLPESEQLEARGAPRKSPPPSEPAPAPPSRPLREPYGWDEPPLLLVPDPMDGFQRRRTLWRALRVAAMIAVVVMGGKLLFSALEPGKPELQFTDRELNPPTVSAPAVVSREERAGREPPAAPAPPVGASRQQRTATPSVETAKKAAEPQVLADQGAKDTAADQVDTAAAFIDDAIAEDTAPAGAVVATAPPENPPVTEPERRGREDADLETRRAAAAALAELDRERIRSRANAATAALPPAQAETSQTVAPPPPPTLEQRAQIYLRIGLDEAVRQLGRPMHVIETMSPQFIGLTQGRNVPGADPSRPAVRVVYRDTRGRMILLDQQRLRPGQAPGAASGSLRWTLGDVMLYLHGEPGPEILRNLQQRVR